MAGASPVQTQEDLVPPAPAAIGYRLSGVLLAPAVAVATQVALTGPFGLDLPVPAGPGSTDLADLGLLQTAIVVLVLGIVGWISVMALERFLGGPKGRRIWTFVAVGVFVVSLAPVALLDIGLAEKWGLFVLNLLTAVVLIPTLANGREAEPLHRDA